MGVEAAALSVQLAENRLLAVIRTKNPEEALKSAKEAVAAGVAILEIAWTTPGAVDVVQSIRDHKWPVTLGAGTITTPSDAVSALQAGAEFLVAPSFSAEVHEVALKRGVSYIPGVFTPQDVSHASRVGLKLLKLFPAVTGGVVHLTAMKEPFPDIDWIPTGGVTWDVAPHWIEAGALAVGMGGALFRTPSIRESVQMLKELRR